MGNITYKILTGYKDYPCRYVLVSETSVKRWFGRGEKTIHNFIAESDDFEWLKKLKEQLESK